MSESDTDEEVSTDFSEGHLGNYENLSYESTIFPNLPVLIAAGDENTFEFTKGDAYFASYLGTEVVEAEMSSEEMFDTDNIERKGRSRSHSIDPVLPILRNMHIFP